MNRGHLVVALMPAFVIVAISSFVAHANPNVQKYSNDTQKQIERLEKKVEGLEKQISKMKSGNSTEFEKKIENLEKEIDNSRKREERRTLKIAEWLDQYHKDGFSLTKHRSEIKGIN